MVFWQLVSGLGHEGGVPPKAGLLDERSRNWEYVKRDLESPRIDGSKEDMMFCIVVLLRKAEVEKDEAMFI